MAVVVVGINERDMPLDVFEQGAIAERDLGKALQALRDSQHVSEVVVLSTCLRTEVYAVIERFHDGLTDIEAFFASRSNALEVGAVPLSEHLACWIDEAAVSHLFEVAAGIDSPLLGEGEILRQVRRAAELAREEHASGPVLGALFRHAVESGKRVRAETKIAQGPTSLAHAAVALAANQLQGGLEDRSVLVVGAGEMGAGFTKALAQEGARFGITVNAIAPGYVDTEMVRAVPGEVLRKIVAKIPMGRLGHAEDIARGVAFLTADDADFVTGSTLSINGGMHMY